MRLLPSLAALLVAASPALAAPQVVQKGGDAPHLKPGGTLVVRTDCPSGRAAASGGYEVTGAAPGTSLVAVADRPASSGGQGATGWSVSVLNASDKTVPAHLDVFAVCQ